MRAILLLIFVAVKFQAFSQANNKEISSYIDSIFQKNDFNGIIQISDSQKKYIITKGYRDIENKGALEITNNFFIASVSKLFLATWFLEKINSNEINPNQKIIKYLPEIPDTTISIVDLLNHSSNIEDYFFTFPEIYELKKDNSEKGIYNYILKHCFTSIGKSKKFIYANENYFLLALIVQKITNQKFEKVLNEHFIKIGLSKNTRIEGKVFYSDSSTLIPNRKGKNVNSVNFKSNYKDDLLRENIIGAGDIFTNLNDIAIFGNYILKLSYKEKEILFNNCFYDSTYKLTKCFGFDKSGLNGNMYLSHSGYLLGLATTFVVDERRKKVYFIINTKEKETKGLELSKSTFKILEKVININNK